MLSRKMGLGYRGVRFVLQEVSSKKLRAMRQDETSRTFGFLVHIRSLLDSVQQA